jgi:hypothetical protein
VAPVAEIVPVTSCWIWAIRVCTAATPSSVMPS